MGGESKQARSATTALIYLTLGALIDVWTIVYYVYLSRHEGSDTAYLWCHGFLFTGMVLIGIGLAVGRIGRNARQAEVGHVPDVAINAAPPAVVANTPALANGVLQPPMPAPQAPPAPVVNTVPMQTSRF